jgi:[protein-PII] uridylyltransferase
LLGLAIILHDIGKGQGKNHSEIGARMAVNICRRIGLNLDETDTIVALVRHHLLMSHISQRRDLHDIDIINHFINYFDDPEDIKLLYLLTYADTNAVGGQVFNEWKNMLLTELYEKAIGALSAENLTREFKKIVERKRIKITERYDDKDFVAYALESMDDEYVYSNKLKHIYRHLGMIQKLSAVNNVIIFSEKRDDLKCVEFTICTYDFIGLLRKLAGVFSLYEFNILGAQINTFSNNIAIDTIQVSNEKEHTDFIDEKSAEVEKTIKKAIDHQLDIESLLEIKSKRNFFTRQRSVTPVPSKIEFDNDISSTYTVVDVYTEDKLGLLYNLLSVFEKLNISVVKAKISTDVDRVVDSFYIMDENNKKITDTKEINKIKKELEKVI